MRLVNLLLLLVFVTSANSSVSLIILIAVNAMISVFVFVLKKTFFLKKINRQQIFDRLPKTLRVWLGLKEPE